MKTASQKIFKELNSVNYTCSLGCRSEQSGQIRHFGISLKDGSECRREDSEKAACLAGICQHVGCDNIIGSTSRNDQCDYAGRWVKLRKNYISLEGHSPIYSLRQNLWSQHLLRWPQ
uniref:Uncharacterized protein n=1 Tax=Ditylenchus dipsaci TaxID=166011 RepID=A0A915E544_9BILA